MRPFLHLISVLFLLPGVALAAAFLILGHAIATSSLLGFFGALLEIALWLIPWGILAAIAATLMLVVGGFSLRFRWLAGICVAAIAIGSSAVVIALSARPDNFSAGQLTFFLPALIAAGIGVWLAATEYPRPRAVRSSQP